MIDIGIGGLVLVLVDWIGWIQVRESYKM